MPEHIAKKVSKSRSRKSDFEVRRFLFRRSRIWAKKFSGVAKNEIGQMSVFLALIFQVLFIFFAMVINIGLLVHDKINLQNSVDFGAYYAAQRQAEILNEIAHLNYQIRQDYKLLAFRVRVIGTLGHDGGTVSPSLNWPAARQPSNFPAPPDSPYMTSNGSGGFVEELPVVCISARLWWEFARSTAGNTSNIAHYCQHKSGFQSTPIPHPNPPMTPATAFLNILVGQFANNATSNSIAACQDSAAASWQLAMFFLAEYKFSVARRKQRILALSDQLVRADFVDTSNQPVKTGVTQTISKNLTDANRATLSGVEVINGLAQGPCSNPGFVLPEIRTKIGLTYSLLTAAGSSCAFYTKFHPDHSQIPMNSLNTADPTMFLRNYIGSGEPLASDPLHSSLGYEKNPWCMAWVGVKAKTKPRKPFAPFGSPVQLEARSFAQPFGGRIGPWYAKRWTHGAPTSIQLPDPVLSVAPNAGLVPPPAGAQDRVDPLTSPRVITALGTITPNVYDIPNYSRYPGDAFGLRSQLAQAQFRNFFSTLQLVGNAAPIRGGDQRLSSAWFTGFTTIANTGDTAAWEPSTSTTPPAVVAALRNTEMAAVAPDLFDIAYYSIDPRSVQNYVDLQANVPGRYPGVSGIESVDVGNRRGFPGLGAISVDDQIVAGNTSGTDQSLSQKNYWRIRSWDHLLTGWAPNDVSDFSFPGVFGKCYTPASDKVMIPGKCAVGGRVGYSVRFIARSHLLGHDWAVGGDNEQPGAILNQPPAESAF